ncbi:MAG: hypothetical protein N4A47_01370 [Clostridia bacterium]|jgi:uncharacterized protein (UPF0210 family)|nr:hypothetical protein [Clostridia bacterium]
MHDNFYKEIMEDEVKRVTFIKHELEDLSEGIDIVHNLISIHPIVSMTAAIDENSKEWEMFIEKYHVFSATGSEIMDDLLHRHKEDKDEMARLAKKQLEILN